MTCDSTRDYLAKLMQEHYTIENLVNTDADVFKDTLMQLIGKQDAEIE